VIFQYHCINFNLVRLTFYLSIYQSKLQRNVQIIFHGWNQCENFKKEEIGNNKYIWAIWHLAYWHTPMKRLNYSVSFLLQCIYQYFPKTKITMFNVNSNKTKIISIYYNMWQSCYIVWYKYHWNLAPLRIWIGKKISRF
jgi:hypothetical protein